MVSAPWKPIETAPLNGTLVLLWVGDPVDTNDLIGFCPSREMHVVVGWWDGVGWSSFLMEESETDTEGRGGSHPVYLCPTHWMPLPEGPAAVPAPAGSA